MTNLLGLQEQLQEKTDELTELRSELDNAYQKIGELQEQLQSEQADKSILANNSEEAYNAGRREATEELSLENTKLRQMIDGLHADVSAKQKKIAEADFKINDLRKQIERLSSDD